MTTTPTNHRTRRGRIPLPAAGTITGGYQVAGPVGHWRFIRAELVAILAPRRAARRSALDQVTLVGVYVVVVMIPVLVLVGLALDAPGILDAVTNIGAVVGLVLVTALVILQVTGTTYTNATRTAYLRVRPTWRGAWVGNSHIKTHRAGPDDARELRRAVLAVLLPAAAAEGVQLKLTAADPKLAAAYATDVAHVLAEAPVGGYTLTYDPNATRTVPMRWGPDTRQPAG